MVSSPQAGRWLSPKLVVGGCVVPSSSEKIGLSRPGIEAGPITHGQILTCDIGIPQVVGSTAVIPSGCVSDSRVRLVAVLDIAIYRTSRAALNNSDLNTGGVDVSTVGILEASVQRISGICRINHLQND